MEHEHKRLSSPKSPPHATIRLQQLVQMILDQFVLNVHGIHGISHWARVLENGRKLAQQTGADVEVVELFAILHDAKRLKEGTDREHGVRGRNMPKRYGERMFTFPKLSLNGCIRRVLIIQRD